MTYVTWGQHAERVIAKAIAAGKAAGEGVAAIRERVDAAYPFGQRQYHPYKQWLRQRRILFIEHGLATDKEKEKALLYSPRRRSRGFLNEAELEALAKRDGLIA